MMAAPPLAPQSPSGQTFDDRVMKLLRDDRMRGFLIDIETDSTIQPDEDAEKQRRTEFITGLGSFLGELAQLPPMALPALLPMLSESLLFLVRGFRAGRSLEEVIERSMQQLGQQMQQAAANPQPDPKVQAEQAKAQAAQAQAQAKSQAVQEQAQANTQKVQGEMALNSQELQIKQQELALKAQELQMREREMNMEAAFSQREAAMREREMAMGMQATERQHQLGQESMETKHDMGLEMMAAKAKQAKANGAPA
jgi:hypothetical protein